MIPQSLFSQTPQSPQDPHLDIELPWNALTISIRLTHYSIILQFQLRECGDEEQAHREAPTPLL